MDELERIVRDVALPDVWIRPGGWCVMCGALVDSKGEMEEPHDDDCPFGRAVAWVAAHPEAE